MFSSFRPTPFLKRLRQKLRHWRSVWLARRKVRAIPGGGAIAAPDYRDYLVVQIAKSQLQANPAGETQPRTRHLVGLLARHLPAATGRAAAATRVLCVGCRDVRELDEIERQTGGAALGVDLFSDDPRIVVGDFHQLPFPDAAFDVLYSCHSLEHAYDLGRALGEFTRVLRPGGLWAIEVPTAFELGATDRQDVGSAAGLLERLRPDVAEVLWLEDAVRADGRRRDARLIARKLEIAGSPALAVEAQPC